VKLLVQASKNLVEKYEKLVKKQREEYQNLTWSKALSFLKVTDSAEILKLCIPPSTPKPKAKKLIKAKFEGFNTEFQEIYNSQRVFTIPDSDLRSQLRNDNVELVLKAYKTFLSTYGAINFSDHPGKYIKYDVATIEVMLNKFFDEET